MYNCVPEGICAKQISFSIENGTLHNVRFVGGCPGNLEAISRLLEGASIDDVIAHCAGIRCGNKPTSCPDQLARMLQSIKNGATPQQATPTLDAIGFGTL